MRDGLLIAIAGVLAACGQPSATTSTTEENPQFSRKLEEPHLFRVERVPKSICGTNDLQHVNAYDGSLGPSSAFINMHKFAVGALASGGDSDSDKYCSGTLIGPDLFLTASHCVDSRTIADFVSFQYELTADRTDSLAQTIVGIEEIVEDGAVDYAVLRLAGEPGLRFGWTPLRIDGPDPNEAITIVQHPLGDPKQIEAGTVLSTTGTYLNYGDLDTEPGSSGSGILDENGQIIGVHTLGGCYRTGGSNAGVRLTATNSTLLDEIEERGKPLADGTHFQLSLDGEVLTAQRGLGSVSLRPGALAAATDWEAVAMGDGQYQIRLLDGGTTPQYIGADVQSGSLILAAAATDQVTVSWRILSMEGDRVAIGTVAAPDKTFWLSDINGGSTLSETAVAWAINR